MQEVQVIKGLRYWGLNYSQCMTEFQGKSILVWVKTRFELARVRVIGSQLYNFGIIPYTSTIHLVSNILEPVCMRSIIYSTSRLLKIHLEAQLTFSEIEVVKRFFLTFPECSLPITYWKNTIKKIGQRAHKGNMMGQFYPVFDCTSLVLIMHVRYFISPHYTLLK